MSDADRPSSRRGWILGACLGCLAGVILGIFLGVHLTLIVQTGSAPYWRDSVIAGHAVHEAVDSVNHREPLLPPPDVPSQPQQQ